MSSSEHRDAVFHGIYAHHYPEIIRILSLRIGNLHAAEDLAQEIFMKLYSRLEGISNFSGWLHAALRNNLYDHFRESMKKPSGVSIHDPGWEEFAPFVSYPVSDAGIVLEETLSGVLDDDDRRLLEFIAVEGLTYQEAGARLGLTTQQTRYRYATTRRRIQNDLASRGIRGIEDLA